MPIALDGEPVEVTGPLRLRVAPGALRVLLPPVADEERSVGAGQLLRSGDQRRAMSASARARWMSEATTPTAP